MKSNQTTKKESNKIYKIKIQSNNEIIINKIINYFGKF